MTLVSILFQGSRFQACVVFRRRCLQLPAIARISVDHATRRISAKHSPKAVLRSRTRPRRSICGHERQLVNDRAEEVNDLACRGNPA